MKRLLMILMALALVGCGPNAQQRRACEMFADAGGVPLRMESVEHWLKHYNEPAEIAKTERERNEWRLKYPNWQQPDNLGTPEQQAERMAEIGREWNAKARGVVALRLTMSQREVNNALVACGDKMLKQAGLARPAK